MKSYLGSGDSSSFVDSFLTEYWDDKMLLGSNLDDLAVFMLIIEDFREVILEEELRFKANFYPLDVILC